MTKVAITPDGMPKAGPYSIALKAGSAVYLSGQVPMNPATGKLVEGTIQDQAKQCLENLTQVLAADGMTFADVVKCTVFLTDMGDFAAVNEVYTSYMVDPFPARSCIQVAGLPLGARVEIEAIAHKPA
ncbi:MAG: RidA family protein [Pseudomonadota bacterium]